MDNIDIINRIQLAMIEREDTHPSIDVGDQAVIQSILHEIKLINESSVSFRNIEELSQYHIRGAGSIVSKYIWALKSQTARSGLLHHLMGNRSHHCARVKNCNELVWKLFLDYLSSDDCFDSGILNDYDNAFATLKPKEYATELIEVSKNPCLFNNMPRTMRMLASWQEPGFKDVLFDYFMNPQRIEEYLSKYSMDKRIHMDDDRIKREIDWWQKSGKYTTISGLKYYASEQTAAMLTQHASELEKEMKIELQKCTDRYAKSDIRYRYSSIQKTLRDSISYIEREITNGNG
ncbi:MAG: hypothetical protein E7322_08755 [Clostridiales bacterium]|nr:hypothetical protein [Clostridiales bacterium]